MKAEIACIVDRSGSMAVIWPDAVGGFKTFLQAQKEVPGEAKFMLVAFDSEYEIVQPMTEIQCVPNDIIGKVFPRGSTALFDAIGKTVNSIGARLDAAVPSSRPDKVIVAILTDGEENASIEYTRERIAGMIKHQQEKYSWEFIFLAANQDAFATGSTLNIPAQNTANFAATGIGVRDAYETMNVVATGYRTTGVHN